VHGGADFTAPVRVDDQVMNRLRKLEPLAPLHQPHNLSGILTCAMLRPHVPQVACFDTAFHQTMDSLARRLGLPRAYDKEGVRRCGFHGLSYEFIAQRLRAIDPDLACGRVIVSHLGNGASLCAMRDGRSIDTTMGFTPLDGLLMGTRPGTLDPGAVTYLMREHAMSAGEIEDVLYHRSGLLGISGISSDMRTLLASDDSHAREAVELFVFRAAREIGALTASLGGLDGLVFTAGIGEHASEIRSRVCALCAWLGVILDENANRAGQMRITARGERRACLCHPYGRGEDDRGAHGQAPWLNALSMRRNKGDRRKKDRRTDQCRESRRALSCRPNSTNATAVWRSELTKLPDRARQGLRREVTRSNQELQPARPFALGAGFRATQAVALGDDPDKGAGHHR
jgi:acetate kinase